MKEGSMRKMNIWVELAVIMLAVVLVSAPAVNAANVERLIFASAGFGESNRFWTVGRPDLLQFDPFLETLLDVDPKTGKFIPRLAERWESSPDAKVWTFYLRKGVQFHYGLLLEKIYLHGICHTIGVSIRWLIDFMVERFEAAPDHVLQAVGGSHRCDPLFHLPLSFDESHGITSITL